MHRLFVAALACVALFAVTVVADDKDDKEKKKYTVKDVMKKAMKGDLFKKVASEKASDKEVDTLLAMFESMGKQKPKKGDEKSWKEKCDALVSAVKDVKAKKKDGIAKLKKAGNCKSCHSKHK